MIHSRGLTFIEGRPYAESLIPHSLCGRRVASSAADPDLEMAMKRMMMQVAVVVVALMVVAIAPAAQAAFDGSFKFSACNLSKSKAGSPFEKAVVAVLANLASETPFNSYDYLNNQANSGSTAFGRGSCRYGLADCTACLEAAGKQIRTACPHAVGARLQIGDCFIQYESQAIQSI